MSILISTPTTSPTTSPEPNPLTRLRRQTPLAAAWIASQLLFSLIYTLGILYPQQLFNFVTAHHFQLWARDHTSLTLFLALAVPLASFIWLLNVLSPELDRPRSWPVADQQLRFALETRLHRLRWFHLVAILFLLILVELLLARLTHDSPFLSPVSALLLAAFISLFNLRGTAKPHPPLPSAAVLSTES